MISLNIQLKMILFSLSYGLFFYYLLYLIKPLIYNKKMFLIIILFGILNGLLFFVVLKKINYGILNENMLVLFVFGCLICKWLLEKK